MNNTPIELNACSCGSIPAIASIGKLYYVRCSECGNGERGAHKTPEEAITAWNFVSAQYYEKDLNEGWGY
jgi:hypothetical protein